MTENIMIQIGLNDTLELDFLSLPSFKEINKVSASAGWKFHIPQHLIDTIGKEPFRVVGVEMNPERVASLKKRYVGYPRIEIRNYVIYREDRDSIQHNTYSLYEHKNNSDIFYQTPALSLQTLCERLRGEYPQRCIYGIWMNIEFAEKEVIEGIEWQTFVKPKFLQIAMHSPAIRDTCNDVLTSNGYTQLHSEFREYNVYSLGDTVCNGIS